MSNCWIVLRKLCTCRKTENRMNEFSLHNWREIGSYNVRDNLILRRDVEVKSVSGSDHSNCSKM